MYKTAEVAQCLISFDSKNFSIFHTAESSFRTCNSISYSRSSQHFMEPICSLPCLQQPSSNRSIQSIPLHSITLRFILILFLHLFLGLPSGHIPYSFPTKKKFIYLYPFVRNVLPISLPKALCNIS
jgi:hypothetical protein